MKHFIIFFVLCIAGYLVRSQSQPTFDKMVDFLPPPPNAASIIRYGEVSLNKNTGSPNVSIPLFTLPGKKLSAAVSIAYSSGGIRVDEIASRVGIGWSISAGGVVTRTVRGVPDETNTRQEPYATVGFNFATYNYMKKMAESSAHGLSNGYDSEPDMFNFNFNGYSGSFVFNNQMQVRQVQRSAVKIEYDFSVSATYNFKFTTPDGISYLFGGSGAIEKTKREQTCGKSFDEYIATSWYLKEIRHPNGEKITFTYTAHEYRYDNGVSQTMFKNLVVDVGCDACSTPVASTTCINVVRTQGVLLSGISSSGYGQINFTYIHRPDCEDKLISRIELTDSVNVIGSYDLKYDTVTSYSTYNNESYFGNSKTPYLRSLIENSSDGSLHKTHYFSYNDPAGRPSRLSFSQDHWGFFNGQVNSTFTPFMGNAFATLFPAASANRDPKFDYASKGLLNKIIYPTGGVTMLVYEPHSVSDNLDFDTRHEFQCEVTGTSTSTEVIKTKSFSIAQGQWIELGLQCIDNSGNGSFDPVHNTGRVEILNSDNAVVFDEVLSPATNVTRYVSLSAGTYTLKYRAKGTVVTTRPTLKFYLAGTSPGQVEATGGARIRAVLQGNPGERPMITQYYYGSLSNLTESSLNVSWSPQYLGTTIKELPCQAVPGQTYRCLFQTLNSSSLRSLFDFASSHINYAAIVEGQGENFEGGGTENTFLVGSDALGEVLWNNDIISSPLSNFSATFNGRPESESIFKKHTDGSLRVIKKTQYSYKQDTRGDSALYGYAIAMKVPQVAYMDSTCNLNVTSCADALSAGLSCFDMMRYSVFSRWVYADTVKETMYDENGLNPQINTSVFTYANADHLQVTKVKAVNSLGQVVETNNKYPSDYSGQQVYANMIAKNDIVRVVDITQTENSLPVFEAKTNYDAVGNNNHEPVSLETSQKGNSLEVEGTIDLYDEKGNILQFTGKSGIVNSVIWGYGKKYPVAKITGASYSAATAELSVTISQLQSLDGAALKSEINRIRTNLPLAQVTTYTHKHMIGVTGITDPNNKTQSFEYDVFNRLVHVRDKDSNLLKKTAYSYVTPDTSATLAVFFNEPVTISIGANTCATGYQPYALSYVIPAKRYFSLVSQPAANALANADPFAQAFANKYSHCANTVCSGQGYALINCVCELGQIYPVSCSDNTDGTWVQNYKYQWSDNSIGTTTYSRTLPACAGEGKKKINCNCYTGLKIYRYSYQNGNGTWTCVYYYHFSDNTNSQDYSEISAEACTGGD
ncbi:MAG: SpvB/TcaC N-terminal domain-containing protein [Chitinophagaceae bacterium]